MQVKTFASLLDIWKLADSNTRDICILPDGAYLLALHCWALRRPSAMRNGGDAQKIPIKEPLTVDGASALGALALLDQEAELEIKQTGASLILNAGGRRAMLRTKEASPPDLSDASVKGKRINTEKLRDALPFLASCAAGSIGVNPVLGGIEFRAIGTDGRSRLAATDHERRSAVTTLKLALKSGEGYVVPAEDLGRALGVLGRDVAVQFVDGRLRLGDGETTISLSLIAGEFPSLKVLPRPKAYSKQIEIEASAVQTAVRAALLFDADRMLAFVIKDGKAAFIVQGQETGGFRVPLGKSAQKDVTIMLDAGMLEALSGLDTTVVLRYKDDRSALLFTDRRARRLCWVMPLVRA